MRSATARLAVLMVPLAICLAPSAAHAAWLHSATGAQTAKALAMPGGSTPSATASNRSVTVSWSQATLAGNPVAGYVVKRYDGGGNAQTVGSGCSGTVTTLSCTETAVPSGTWTYTVTPKQSNWVGAESARSASVTVAAPALAWSGSSTVTSLPATMSGTISNYVPGQTLTFRLDDATSGPTLTGSISPSPVAASGSASVSVTIPGGTSNGQHTVYAVGNQGDVASATVTVSTPTVTAAVIDRSANPSCGANSTYVKQGGTFYVYANVTGTPSAVTADVSSIKAGQTAVPLTAGSYSVGGSAYGYRSAALTADATLAQGARSYTVTAGGSSQTNTVTVDNTGPTATDVQTLNGGTAGRPDTGDTVTYSTSELLSPTSLVATWCGSTTQNVVVRISNANKNDTLTVYDATNTAQLPLGSIALGGDYVTANTTYGASGTPSTMTQSGTSITVTLGTLSGSPQIPSASTTMVWTPATAATDRAGNAMSGATATETGTADRDF